MNISKIDKAKTDKQFTAIELEALEYWVSGPINGIDYPIIEDGLGELPLDF